MSQLGAQEKIEAVDLRKGQRRLLCQRVLRRDADKQLLLQKGLCSCEWEGQDGDVARTVFPRGKDIFVLADGGGQHLFRLRCVQLPQQLPQGRGRAGADDDGPLPLVKRADLRDGQLRFLQQFARRRHGQLAGLVQLDPVLTPREERHSEILLQMLHRACNGRCGEMKFFCHAVERAEIGERRELLEFIQIDHDSLLLHFIF